ncbi:MAG TPA: transcription elongation factor GreA [Anaerolineales bacterium]|nr:transcription elongation factor GreA [Anaerolineales bacterium]
MEERTFLTRDGLKKLGEELEHLRTVRRAEVAERLHNAQDDGELIENAEYEDAKNEQAFVEGRILQLETMLSNAAIIDTQGPDNGVVGLGCTVTVKEADSRKGEEYTLVGAVEANPREGRISNESPLGRALLGHKVGDEIKVQAPAGAIKYKITKIRRA